MRRRNAIQARVFDGRDSNTSLIGASPEMASTAKLKDRD
jgi:hypothetical protein